MGIRVDPRAIELDPLTVSVDAAPVSRRDMGGLTINRGEIEKLSSRGLRDAADLIQALNLPGVIVRRRGDGFLCVGLVVLPSQGGSGKSIVNDLESQDRPIAYTKTPEFQSLGMYGSSEDITGGMGLEGVLELQKFVAAGGVIMTLGNATTLPTDFGLVRSINASRPSGNFYAPRPIVEGEVTRPEHPVFYGYTEKTLPLKFTNGRLLQVPEADRDEQVLMKFVGGDKAVLSGLMRGADQIKDRPAIVDVPVGEGRLLMYSTNPVYRWQNHGEFNMLFNALMNYDDLDVAVEKKPVTQDGGEGAPA